MNSAISLLTLCSGVPFVSYFSNSTQENYRRKNGRAKGTGNDLMS